MKRINPDIWCQDLFDIISVRSYILRMYMASEVTGETSVSLVGRK